MLLLMPTLLLPFGELARGLMDTDAGTESPLNVATGLFDAHHALNGSEAPNGFGGHIATCARRHIIKHDGNRGSGSDGFKMSKETFLSGAVVIRCHQQTGICASGFCFLGLVNRFRG